MVCLDPNCLSGSNLEVGKNNLLATQDKISFWIRIVYPNQKIWVVRATFNPGPRFLFGSQIVYPDQILKLGERCVNNRWYGFI